MRVLFLPSHVGLGHVARDYAIAVMLRRLVPKASIEWCSAEPVLSFLGSLGEELAPGCVGLESFSTVIEDLYNGRIRGLRELGSRLGVLRRNYEVIRGLVEDESYGLVFADEFWEVVYAAPPRVKQAVVFGTDILYKPFSLNPVDSLVSFILNRYFKRVLPGFRELIFMNDPGVFGARRWYGFFGGRVADWVRQHTRVVGLVTSFAPGEIPGREEARRRLGFSLDEFVVVVSVGGTSTRSKALLDCIDSNARAIVEAAREAAGAREVRIIVLPGPRTEWEPRSSLIEARHGLVPRLLDYYAAADLFITRAGRTTTADLLCLGKPAVLVPIKGHFEQEDIARDMSRRYNHPVLSEDECSSSSLRRAVEEALRVEIRPPEGLCRGVEYVAKLLAGMIRAEKQWL